MYIVSSALPPVICSLIHSPKNNATSVNATATVTVRVVTNTWKDIKAKDERLHGSV